MTRGPPNPVAGRASTAATTPPEACPGPILRAGSSVEAYRRKMTLFLLLAACDAVPTPGACDDELPERPAVGACFGRPGLDYAGFGLAELLVHGDVVSVTTGPLPAACDVRFGDDGGDDTVVLVVADAEGVETTVGLVAPGLAAPVAVGDAVSLDLAYTFGEFGPDIGHAVLADATGAEQVVIGTAGTVDALRTPEGVTVGEGAVRCTQADECGTWSAFDFLVAAGSAEGAVSYGEDAVIGPWRVVHADLRKQVPTGGSSCPDWFVADARAAFIRE